MSQLYFSGDKGKEKVKSHVTWPGASQTFPEASGQATVCFSTADTEIFMKNEPPTQKRRDCEVVEATGERWSSCIQTSSSLPPAFSSCCFTSSAVITSFHSPSTLNASSFLLRQLVVHSVQHARAHGHGHTLCRPSLHHLTSFPLAPPSQVHRSPLFYFIFCKRLLSLWTTIYMKRLSVARSIFLKKNHYQFHK